MADQSNLNSPLAQLRARQRQLEQSAEPLRTQLSRCDDAIARLDAAQAARDEALAVYDEQVAASTIYGQVVVAVDPGPANIAESKLREASAAARAALRVRADIDHQLAAINNQLSQCAADIENEVWASLPSAAAHLFAAAEAASREFAAAMSRIDSVARIAHAHAYQQANGRPPQLTPAWHAFERLQVMKGSLAAQLTASTELDHKTGPELLRAVEAGTATFGDVSRWTPPRRGAPDGTSHLNRGAPASWEPPGSSLPNPAITAPEPEQAPSQPPSAPAEAAE
jgi:hypothetical protein